MFSRGKFTDEETAPPSRMATGGRNTTFSIIGSDVVITGNIAASVDLHVDGQVEGDLTCAALVQGEGSRITGAITRATAPVAALIIAGLPPKNAMETAITKEEYRPTFGSTPAIIENEIDSGMRASATTSPARTSRIRIRGVLKAFKTDGSGRYLFASSACGEAKAMRASLPSGHGESCFGLQ